NNAIIPAMHSADICCSVAVSSIYAKPKDVLDAAMASTHFGYGRNPLVNDSFMPDSLANRIENNPFTRGLLRVAIDGLGTQGDGNHFLFVSKEDSYTGTVDLVTHHGSRAFGAKVFKNGKSFADHITKT